MRRLPKGASSLLLTNIPWCVGYAVLIMQKTKMKPEADCAGAVFMVKFKKRNAGDADELKRCFGESNQTWKRFSQGDSFLLFVTKIRTVIFCELQGVVYKAGGYLLCCLYCMIAFEMKLLWCRAEVDGKMKTCYNQIQLTCLRTFV